METVKKVKKKKNKVKINKIKKKAMKVVQEFLEKPILTDSSGKTLVNFSHVAAMAVGLLGLYMMIPERKRRNLFK
ncbi:hypothetical protein J4771_02365 [Candidatus Kaistella beijingensis]|uniref:hypothetical protein n=1 Tax=Candidatus Kaistella beijingensis TaxID=2820270 RepID=UPI001CC7B776|nr:hypothetical protein [Candidatus Kaistella beijingensis]UBB90220.1 hypothetical protein J4771_02365 [Candidatus Kaistella beijingensis]